jgi:hypothetical protein
MIVEFLKSEAIVTRQRRGVPAVPLVLVGVGA